jgi:N-acetylmuramoyl-L-alanine amidase
LLNFSAPVNPTISTEPGKLRMVFKRDPVVSPGSQSISFDNKVITHASYSENNGDAELDVAASQPLMASFSSDRRTITISAIAPPPGPQLRQRRQNWSNRGRIRRRRPCRRQTVRPITIAAMVTHRILAVVDPAHGGDERGAALTDTLAEKDVTLGFARLLRHELEHSRFRRRCCATPIPV